MWQLIPLPGMEVKVPNLPERKVGIVACSGEELPEGTVTRLAALKVLHELRSGKTVTICLPLFLAGGAGDRAFARFHPTITVDGCELRCAARGTEMYSGKPAASIVISDLVREHQLGKIEGRRELNEAGRRAVDLAAQRITELVDEILGISELNILQPTAAAQTQSKGCSCGAPIPSQGIDIAGRTVELLALPLIFKQFYDQGRDPESSAAELFEAVRLYNLVPLGDEDKYCQAIAREYAAFCAEARQ